MYNVEIKDLKLIGFVEIIVCVMVYEDFLFWFVVKENICKFEF